MKKKLYRALAVWLAVSLVLPAPGWAQSPAQTFSNDELDDLLAPIALYPDPLLAQLLPAATFIDQVDAAARWLRAGNDPNRKAMPSDWDLSVQSLAHYPDLVSKMADQRDWATALGQAYVQQQPEVLASIQRLRRLAEKMGNLTTTPQQTVVVEKEVITVVPAQPTVIYVPQYNPQVVYVQAAPPPGPSTGEVVAAAVISFGIGMAIGAWLNNDCDYYHGHVYYHGWVGGGWVGVCGPHVAYHGSVWIRPGWSPGYTNITVNRTVINRNVNYNNINHYNNVRVNNATSVNRFSQNTYNSTRTSQTNRVAARNVNNSNGQLNSYRGRTTTTRQTASGTRTTAQPRARSATSTAGRSGSAFSGYQSGGSTRAESARGRASRASGGGRATRTQTQRTRGKR